MKIGLLLLLIFISQTVTAEIYKWVDGNGKVHFGDRPGNSNAVEINVEEGKVKKIINTEGGETLTRDEKRQRILDAMNEDREERDKLKEEESLQRKNKKIKCAQLRDTLRNIERAAGVYNLDENGKRVFLSKKGRGNSERSLKKAIDRNCR